MKTSTCAFIVTAACAAVSCASARPASAQATMSARSYSGLFGGTPDTDARHRFDLTAVVVEAYDDDVTADVGGGVPTAGAPQVSGFYTQFTGAATYGWQGRRVQVAANAASTLRYNNELRDIASASHTAGVGFSAQFIRRTTLFVNQTVAYSPSYLYGLFPSVSSPVPGDVQPAAPDYAINDLESYSYGTVATLSRGVTGKGTLSGTAEFQYTDFLRESLVRRDVKAYTLRGQFSRNLTRYGAFRIGYQYRSGDFGYGAIGSTTEHGVDVGVDYTKSLSPTRRAVFTFSLGSSAADAPALNGIVSGRQYRVLGDAAFAYQFGRSWQARASYRRGLEYVAELTHPVYTDGVTAVLEGLLSRRLDFSGSAGYSTGASALQRDATAFKTYTGNLRVRYALSRMWATYGEYLYYFYDFTGAIALPPGTPPQLERNGIRAGLTLWIPVRPK